MALEQLRLIFIGDFNIKDRWCLTFVVVLSEQNSQILLCNVHEKWALILN